MRANILGCLGGGLKEPHQRRRGDALRLGLAEGAAHLPGNLALAHHRGFQARAHGKKVAGDGVALLGGQRLGDLRFGQPGMLADGSND